MCVSVTILTACYNAEATILRTCRSIDAQRLPEGFLVEHLVLDGKSRDGTLMCIAEYELQRHADGIAPGVSRTVLSKPDRGLYDALNVGLAKARGDLIGVLNADDFLARDDVLSRILDLFSTPTTDGVYGDLLYVKARKGRLVQHRYWRPGDFRPSAVRRGWMPPHPTLYLRRRLYEQAGNFRIDFGSAADYEFMVRLMRLPKLRLAYLPAVLVCMETGGLSNCSLAARWRAHRMDRKAWTENKVTPGILTLPLKPLRKLPQFWQRYKRFIFPEWAISSEEL
jgi:glycosyltransferase involved in cell wall biosynthesis